MYKTFIKNYTISTTILLFIIIYVFCITTKPAFMFNKNGNIRNFGLGKRNSTVIPIWLFVIILAIMIYITVLTYLR